MSETAFGTVVRVMTGRGLRIYELYALVLFLFTLDALLWTISSLECQASVSPFYNNLRNSETPIVCSFPSASNAQKSRRGVCGHKSDPKRYKKFPSPNGHKNTVQGSREEYMRLYTASPKTQGKTSCPPRAFKRTTSPIQ